MLIQISFNNWRIIVVRFGHVCVFMRHLCLFFCNRTPLAENTFFDKLTENESHGSRTGKVVYNLKLLLYKYVI